MQQAQQAQPHVTYSVYNNTYKPPPPPPASPIAVDPNLEIQALQKKMREEQEVSHQKLHEATAAAQQSVNAKMNEMVSEVKRNENLARAVAASASTDDIRKGRAAQVFNNQLAAELRQAREATSAAKGDVSRMEAEKRAFFEQQMLNEIEKARRKKMDNEKLVEASSTGGPPPPTPGAGRKQKEKVWRMPINNTVQNTPSIQPTGVQLLGPKGAVMPNDSKIPANPTPDSGQHTS